MAVKFIPFKVIKEAIRCHLHGYHAIQCMRMMHKEKYFLLTNTYPLPFYNQIMSNHQGLNLKIPFT